MRSRLRLPNPDKPVDLASLKPPFELLLIRMAQGCGPGAKGRHLGRDANEAPGAVSVIDHEQHVSIGPTRRASRL
jgi:hypothetical protein